MVHRLGEPASNSLGLRFGYPQQFSEAKHPAIECAFWFGGLFKRRPGEESFQNSCSFSLRLEHVLPPGSQADLPLNAGPRVTSKGVASERTTSISFRHISTDTPIGPTGWKSYLVRSEHGETKGLRKTRQEQRNHGSATKGATRE